MKRKVLIGIVALIVVGVIYISLNPPAQEVKTYQVQTGNIQQGVNETGLVQASNFLDIYSVENGQVASLPVEIGSQVSKGDTLVVLTNPDLGIQKSNQQSLLVQAKNNLSMIKANISTVGLDLTEAKNNYERTEKLYQAGAVSKSQLETVKTVKEKLENILQEQKQALGQVDLQVIALEGALQDLEAKERSLVITSPIDGTVVRLPVKDGQFVIASTPVAQVASLNQMEIRTEILSDDMADIMVGQKAIITAPILRETILAGEVVQIYPQAEEKLSALGVIQHRVPVIITLKEANKLRPGYEVKVNIKTLSKGDVLIIPREAIINDENGNKLVMLIEKGRVKHVLVETGLGDRTNIEITKGLKLGQIIVLDGSNLLKEGTRIKEL